MYIRSLQTMPWLLYIIVMSGCLSFGSGCAEQSRTVLEFKNPKIFVHTYDDPAKVGSALHAEGLKIQTRKELGNASADFVITGTGVIHWGSKEIKVIDKSIDIDGTLIESRDQGYRNVVIEKDGSIEKDKFIPFESPWGYHPSNKP